MADKSRLDKVIYFDADSATQPIIADYLRSHGFEVVVYDTANMEVSDALAKAFADTLAIITSVRWRKDNNRPHGLQLAEILPTRIPLVIICSRPEYQNKARGLGVEFSDRDPHRILNALRKALAA